MGRKGEITQEDLDAFLELRKSGYDGPVDRIGRPLPDPEQQEGN